MQYYNNKIQFLAENVFEFSRLFIERLPDDVKEIATQSARQIVRWQLLWLIVDMTL